MNETDRDAYEQARFRGELARAREGDQVALAEVRHWADRKSGASAEWDRLIAEAEPLLTGEAQPSELADTDPTRIDPVAGSARAAGGIPRTRILTIVLFLAVIAAFVAFILFGGI